MSTEHLTQGLSNELNISLKVRRSAQQCASMLSSAHQCPVMRINALQCTLVPSSAQQCSVVHINAHQCSVHRKTYHQWLSSQAHNSGKLKQFLFLQPMLQEFEKSDYKPDKSNDQLKKPEQGNNQHRQINMTQSKQFGTKHLQKTAMPDFIVPNFMKRICYQQWANIYFLHTLQTT